MILNLKCYIGSFYIGTKLKQNKIMILSQFIMKNLKWFILVLQLLKTLLLVEVKF